MTEPCPCWIGPVTIHHHPSHCCFRYPPNTEVPWGEPPPCGHWHPDVPHPTAQMDLFGVSHRYKEGEA